MEKVFRWAVRDDIPQIQRFLVNNFGVNSIQAAPGRFEALFLEHPHGFHVSLCLVDSSIEGVRCYWPIKIGIGETVLNAAFPADTMVSQNFRKQGIGRKFLEMALERFQVNISNGQSPANAALYCKMGATIVSGFRKGYMVRKPALQKSLRPMIRDLIAWGMWLGRKKIFPIVHQNVAPSAANNTLNSIPCRLLAEEAGALIDENVFCWRYANSFYDDYSMVLANCDAEQGLVVFRNNEEETVIVDLFCRAEQIETFIRVAGEILPGKKLTAVFTGKRLESSFCKAGFVVRPIDANLVILAADSVLQKELGRRDWVMFGGDADTDLRYFPKRKPTE